MAPFILQFVIFHAKTNIPRLVFSTNTCIPYLQESYLNKVPYNAMTNATKIVLLTPESDDAVENLNLWAWSLQKKKIYVRKISELAK